MQGNNLRRQNFVVVVGGREFGGREAFYIDVNSVIWGCFENDWRSHCAFCQLFLDGLMIRCLSFDSYRIIPSHLKSENPTGFEFLLANNMLSSRKLFQRQTFLNSFQPGFITHFALFCLDSALLHYFMRFGVIFNYQPVFFVFWYYCFSFCLPPTLFFRRGGSGHLSLEKIYSSPENAFKLMSKIKLFRFQ